MPRFNLAERPQPFIGLFLAALGWVISHQWGSNAVLDDCITHGGGTAVLASVAGLLITAAGGVYSLGRGVAERETDEASSRCWACCSPWR